MSEIEVHVPAAPGDLVEVMTGGGCSFLGVVLRWEARQDILTDTHHITLIVLPVIAALRGLVKRGEPGLTSYAPNWRPAPGDKIPRLRVNFEVETFKITQDDRPLGEILSAAVQSCVRTRCVGWADRHAGMGPEWNMGLVINPGVVVYRGGSLVALARTLPWKENDD